MKKALFIALLMAFFTSCSKSLEAPENFVEPSKQKFIKVSLKGKLHRASKGCELGFSVCGVSFDVSLDFSWLFMGVYKPYKENPNDPISKMKIAFEEPVPHAEAIFFGNDEPAFNFPQNVVNSMGYTSLTILPGNYSYQVNTEHPYGYVIVDVNAVE